MNNSALLIPVPPFQMFLRGGPVRVTGYLGAKTGRFHTAEVLDLSHPGGLPLRHLSTSEYAAIHQRAAEIASEDEAYPEQEAL